MQRKLIILSAVAMTAVSVAVVSADRTFLRDVAENQPVSETMLTITPVQVVNLPTETSGELKVQPTKTVVLDLLDGPVTLQEWEYWTSETFSVERYTRLGVRFDRVQVYVYCDVQWV